MRYFVMSTFLLTAALTGCSESPPRSADDNSALDPNALSSTRPAAMSPDNQAQLPDGPLAKYVGRYPFDEVDGVRFSDHPLVRRAVEAAVADANLRGKVLGEGTAVPIAMRDGRIFSHICEQHNCGQRNWTIIVDPAGLSGEVCYYDVETQAEPRWYSNAGAPQTRAGVCPTGDSSAQ